jgi:hypothetical protein
MINHWNTAAILVSEHQRDLRRDAARTRAARTWRRTKRARRATG